MRRWIRIRIGKGHDSRAAAREIVKILNAAARSGVRLRPDDPDGSDTSDSD